MIKIIHLIPTLHFGGAETMLHKVVKNINKKQFKNIVICIKQTGSLSKKFEAENIEIINLGLKSNIFLFISILKLKKLIKELKPDILMTWLQLSDLVGLIIKIIFPKIKLIWNIRYSKLTKNNMNFKNVLFTKIIGYFSFIPDMIVFNTKAGLNDHKRIGYKPCKEIIIPNGFETELFKPNNTQRKKIRDELMIKNSDFVIGFIGKDEVIKGLDLFLLSAKKMKIKHQNVRFVLIGKGLDKKNKKILNFIKIDKLKTSFHLLGQVQNIKDYILTFDILALTSKSEGFPNVIGEAMSCEIPCVTTDVGDCKIILGKTGLIVKQNVDSVVAGWEKFFNCSTQELSNIKSKARSRIIKHYKIEKIINKYQEVYQSLNK